MSVSLDHTTGMALHCHHLERSLGATSVSDVPWPQLTDPGTLSPLNSRDVRVFDPAVLNAMVVTVKDQRGNNGRVVSVKTNALCRPRKFFEF